MSLNHSICAPRIALTAMPEDGHTFNRMRRVQPDAFPGTGAGACRGAGGRLWPASTGELP
jgi:hypothetical protein